MLLLALAIDPGEAPDPERQVYARASACWRDEVCLLQLGQACDGGT